MKNKIENA